MVDYCPHLSCWRSVPCTIHPPISTLAFGSLNAQLLLGASKLRNVPSSEKKEVKYFSEEDVPVELVPGLYISSLKAASNGERLKELGITHVLTVCTQIPTPYDWLTYQHMPFEDKEHVSLAELLPKCLPFIRTAIVEDKGKCLIHCHHGISRSASICIAYIMSDVHRTSSFAQVWRFVKEKRSIIHPNDGFKAQLTAMERREAEGEEKSAVVITVKREKDNEDKEMFVTVHEDQINNNNLQGKEGYPYTFIDVATGDIFVRPTAEEHKGVPFCHLCFRTFNTFTEQEVHKAKPCYQDTANAKMVPKPIKIIFHADHLTYIGDAIEGLKLSLTNETAPPLAVSATANANTASLSSETWVSVTVDVSDLEITLRRFYFAQISKYNLEQWYPSLATLSPPRTALTVILPLSDGELNLLSRLAAVELSRKMGMSARETNSELEQRTQLEDRIFHCMLNDATEKDVLDPTKTKQAYFCKFSTRSPKDAKATSNKETDGSLEQRLSAKLDALKVYSGIEVIDLLTHSQRIFSDISLYFQYRVFGSSSSELCLILRRWVDCMPQDHEFRCFVSNKQLTAISQYHCYYVFEALQNKQHIEKIREAIVNCFEEVKDCFHLPSYVIDIVVFPDTYACSVIELNPFGSHMSSGAGLFNWEKDRKILYGPCEGQPVIRVLKQLIDKQPSKA